jgi:hypothetical protein
MKPHATILEAISHPAVWRRWFRDPQTWAAWHAFLAALFGLPMSADDLAIYQQCTGRTTPPEGGANEAWLIVGRRGGKSMILALIAVYLATFRDWRPYLVPGEIGTVKVVACDRRQARVIHRYCRALLTQVPTLAQLIASDSTEEIALSNGVAIEIATASFRTIRGFTIIAALLDELAYWPTEDSANPDQEIIDAIRPAMATVPGAMLLAASSPYARRGVLWQMYRRHYGQNEASALIWRAPTRTMNPTVSASLVDAAIERDPASAGAEYLAEFRADIESFVSREAIEAATAGGRFELSPVDGVAYAAFCDPSGGSSDSMTLAIGHRESDRVIVDAIRERRPPFSPADVVSEFAELLAPYRISSVSGDRYGGEWPAERFREHGIAYSAAERSKSDLYTEFLPTLNSGRIELLDHTRLAAQLLKLERRTARGGRDTIDHAPGAHDDIANAVAGVASLLAEDGPRKGRGIFLLYKRQFEETRRAEISDQPPLCPFRRGSGCRSAAFAGAPTDPK